LNGEIGSAKITFLPHFLSLFCNKRFQANGGKSKSFRKNFVIVQVVCFCCSNPTMVINYQLPIACDVRLKVYNVLGKEVMTLVSGRQEAGVYNVTLNAAQLSSGVYFYRLQAGSFVETKKMMLVK
jgi:hypothetical protein